MIEPATLLGSVWLGAGMGKAQFCSMSNFLMVICFCAPALASMSCASSFALSKRFAMKISSSSAASKLSKSPMSDPSVSAALSLYSDGYGTVTA